MYTRSLVERGCGIIGRGLEKISKTNNWEGGWNSREGWNKVKKFNSQGESRLLN